MSVARGLRTFTLRLFSFLCLLPLHTFFTTNRRGFQTSIFRGFRQTGKGIITVPGVRPLPRQRAQNLSTNLLIQPFRLQSL
uniref:Secreted protein n=1 Tax=Helianthus annuus TaxID=4232 RepID=A0A251UHJ0_HELAN